MTNSTTINKPIGKVKIGALTAAIWKTELDNGPVFNVTFDRVYRDKEGNFKHSDSFSTRDLLALAKLADRAHTVIVSDLAVDDGDENGS